MEQKFRELGESVNLFLVNIEGPEACAAFEKEHGLTLPHYGAVDPADVDKWAVHFIPHHAVLDEHGKVVESPSQDPFGTRTKL